MMYGANPEQLAQLGRTLHEQMSVIAQLMSTVDRTIGSTTWQGPARQRFEQRCKCHLEGGAGGLSCWTMFDACGV